MKLIRRKQKIVQYILNNVCFQNFAIIAGAGGGIGRACAIRFAQEGATVIVTDRKFDQAQSTAKKLGGNRISWSLSRVSPNEMFIFCVNNFGTYSQFYL